MYRTLAWGALVLLGLAYADARGYAASNIFAGGTAARAASGGSHK